MFWVGLALQRLPEEVCCADDANSLKFLQSQEVFVLSDNALRTRFNRAFQNSVVVGIVSPGVQACSRRNMPTELPKPFLLEVQPVSIPMEIVPEHRHQFGENCVGNVNSEYACPGSAD